MKVFIDEGVVRVDKVMMLIPCVAFSLYPVVGALVTALNNSLDEELGTEVSNGLKGSILRKLPNVSYFQLFQQDQNKKYAQADNRTNEVQDEDDDPDDCDEQEKLVVGLKEWTLKIAKSMSLIIPELLQQLTTITLVVITMWLVSPKITVICLTAMSILALVKRSLRSYLQLNHDLFKQENKLNVLLARFVQNLDVIQLNVAEESKIKEFEQLCIENRKKRREVFWGKTFINLFSSITSSIVTGIVLVYGTIISSSLSPGEALQYMTYTGTLQISVKWFLDCYVALLEVTPSLENCDRVLFMEEVKIKTNSAVDLHEVKWIEFRGVTATYPGSEFPAIRDLYLTIYQGEKIALVGESGGGKSTIFHLLTRLLEPDSGKILINGRPIEELPIKWLREKIILSQQSTKMLSGSIEDNLRLGNPEATDAEMLEAVFCASYELPMGHKSLKQKAQGSGGQLQRLGVARALLRPLAEVFILDEITSAVDPETEQKMRVRISRRLAGKTQIISTHRYSTIRDADRVVVLKGGKIVEIGYPEKLLANEHSVFYSLWSQQMGV